MAKNKNKPGKLQPSQKIQAPSAFKMQGISKRGWKTLLAGIATSAFGFYVLSLTDPAGQNWASNLCPFLILGGYAAIAIGILLPDKKEEPASPDSPVPQP